MNDSAKNGPESAWLYDEIILLKFLIFFAIFRKFASFPIIVKKLQKLKRI